MKPIVFALSVLLPFYFVESTFAQDEDWTFKNQSDWPGECKTGKEQSPIDINDAEKAEKPEPLSLEGMDKKEELDFSLMHFAVIASMGNAKVTISAGSLLTEIKYLKYISFHTPAEHTIKQTQDPLEIHFIYAKGQGADSPVDAIMAILVTAGKANKDLDEIAATVEKVKEVKDIIPAKVVFKDLLPNSTENFFTYEGSIPHPSCREGITWFVLETKLEMSQEQIDKIAHKGDPSFGPNNRNVQPLNDRKVLHVVNFSTNFAVCLYLLVIQFIIILNI